MHKFLVNAHLRKPYLFGANDSLDWEQRGKEFKEIIENFNQQTIGNEDSKMDYIISDMDVELKAQVSYNSKGKMVLGTPDIANMEKAKESLSVMKFKIRPVPKANLTKIQ